MPWRRAADLDRLAADVRTVITAQMGIGHRNHREMLLLPRQAPALRSSTGWHLVHRAVRRFESAKSNDCGTGRTTSWFKDAREPSHSGAAVILRKPCVIRASLVTPDACICSGQIGEAICVSGT
jgi:hypothetical protein